MKRGQWIGAAVVAIGLLAGRIAQAQTPCDVSGRQLSSSEIATRLQLLNDARAQAAQGHHPDALRLALGACHIQESPSLRMFVAQEELAVGQFGGALNDGGLCERETNQNPSLPSHDDIHNACVTVQNNARPHVGHVVVQSPAEHVEGIHVRVGGQEIDATLIGLPYVVTPGNVPIEVSAPGYFTMNTTVAVTEGHTVEVPVALRREPHSATATVSPQPGTGTQPVVATSNGGGVSVPAIVVLAVGLVGLGVGIALGVVESSDASTLSSHCTGNVCPSMYQSTYNEASTLATVAPVVIIAGAAVTAIGGVWLVVSAVSGGSRHRDRVQLEWSPATIEGAPGAIIRGTF